MRGMRSLAALAMVVVLAGCDQEYSTYDYYVDTYPDFGPDTGDVHGDDVGGDVPVDPTGSKVLGEACASDGECGGVPGSARTCLTDIAGYSEFTNGYCSAVCTSAIDCGESGACVDVMGLGYWCLKRCSSAANCRESESYTCQPVTGSTAGLYCVPNTSPTDY